MKYYNPSNHRYYECSYELLENPYNRHLEAFVSFQDISESMKMEKIVQSLINMNYEAIYTVDLNTMIPTVYHTTGEGEIERLREEGLTYKEYMTSYLKQLGDPNSFERILQENSIAVVTEELQEHSVYNTFFSIHALNRRGEPRQMKTVYRYMDEKQDVLIIVLIDITEEYEEEKREKLQLEIALQNANAANEAKTDFLSRMSHDIRTPMNAILGLADLASKEDTSPKVREYIDKINTSGEFLLQLVNDILDMAKIENGELEFHPEPFSSQQFKEGIETIIEPLIKEKHMHFRMTLASQNSCYLVGRLRFNQIFFNLLSNAVKYTPEGGEIYLYTERIPSIEENKTGIRYHIKDNGIGMSEEFQERIFEPFEQEYNDIVNNSQGTGLGTTIVKRIVDAMGGDIQVHSVPGQGTEFIVDLFLEPADEKPDQVIGQTVEEIQQFLNGKKVLLVEDNEMNILVAKTQLTKIGVEVTVAQNGQEAVDHYTKPEPDTYDAILMDRRMPVMDGIEATKEIRQINQQVPIIAMTADAFDDDTRVSLEAWMNAHLTKPVVPVELYQTLATVIAACPTASV